MSKINKVVFEGCATAIITPFKDGEIDYNSLKQIIDEQIDCGIGALVVCGTTGESATLSDDERRGVIKCSIEYSNGRIPIIAGCGCNNISKAVELAKYSDECGADAVMTVTPYYNKASKSGLIKSFCAVADAINIPLMLYNVPSRTGMDIPIEVYKVLADHDNICAVKEASGNIVTCARILEACDGKLDLYSGCDECIVPTMSLGGKGVISVISNILPRRVCEMCKYCLDGDFVNGACIQLELMKLIRILFDEVNPIPIKCACALMGMCSDEMRLPLCPLDDRQLKKLKSVMLEYGI